VPAIGGATPPGLNVWQEIVRDAQDVALGQDADQVSIVDDGKGAHPLAQEDCDRRLQRRPPRHRGRISGHELRYFDGAERLDVFSFPDAAQNRWRGALDITVGHDADESEAVGDRQMADP
jgi:hypothetical protein